MAFRQRREALRAILSGSSCIRPASVYDAISIRVAEDLGFEVGMFGGSVASLAILGDPDITLITLTEIAEQMRRMSRASVLPVLVDADHGYGNALNVRRTVQELEAAGAAGLTIEDTLLPQAFGEAKAQLISLEEGVGKMRGALDGRGDPSLVVVARTGAASITSLEDAIKRAKGYEATGVDALFFTGIKTRAELEAIAAATRLPIMLGGAPEEINVLDSLTGQRVRIALQGHAPFAAATQAVYETLKALREGVPPKSLKGLASSELTGRLTRDADMKKRGAEFLGIKMNSSIRQIVIRGQVQGVGYRAWVEQQVRARNIEGWVRNRRDGSVEALFAGEADIVSEMIALCRRGPPFGEVEAVEENPGDPDGLNMRFKGEQFSVLPTSS
jgi:oxaloacetate decarboxylase